MKTFKSIAEWLKTNPSEEEMAKILEIVNRGSKRETKKEFWAKEKELKKHLRFANEMKELGYKPSSEMVAKTKELVEEVEKLKEAIGPVVKRVKKEEPTKE